MMKLKEMFFTTKLTIRKNYLLLLD